MKHRLFYTRFWLTPGSIEKVRKERGDGSKGPITPIIEYRRKRVVEDKEFDHPEDITQWVQDQTVMLEGFEDVLRKYVVLWASPEAVDGERLRVIEESWNAEEQLLPI